MSAASTRLDWLVFLALGLMWGSSYLFIKIGVETITPLTLVALRLAVGAAVLAAVVLIAREPLPRTPRIYGHLLVMSILNIVLPFSLITWAELTVPSSLAAILTAIVPLVVIVIAAVALRDEPITANRLIGLAIGFGGVIVLVGPGALAAGADLPAQLALIGASASYALAAVYARRTVTRLRPMVAAAVQVSFALALSVGLALVLERPFELELGPSGLVAVVWLGVLGSGFAYLAFFRLIRSWGATRTSAVAYILPVVGIVMGVLFAGEVVDVRILAGTGLVIGGIALVNARPGAATVRLDPGIKPEPAPLDR
ncbi:EamA family transporter [soil metagenome]